MNGALGCWYQVPPEETQGERNGCLQQGQILKRTALGYRFSLPGEPGRRWIYRKKKCAHAYPPATLSGVGMLGTRILMEYSKRIIKAGL